MTGKDYAGAVKGEAQGRAQEKEIPGWRKLRGRAREGGPQRTPGPQRWRGWVQ